MTPLVLATRNIGKLREISEMLMHCDVQLLSLLDFPDVPEIREDGRTYLENALLKARTVAHSTGEMALADDSGLEVDALHGAPGIFSARYAGPGATDGQNVQKLLEALEGVPPERRGAAFQCVLVFCRPNGVYETFTGCWQGRIHSSPVGVSGFGYDPIFYLTDKGMTVAQLAAEEKNKLSHRAQALFKFKEWLQREIV